MHTFAYGCIVAVGTMYRYPSGAAIHVCVARTWVPRENIGAAWSHRTPKKIRTFRGKGRLIFLADYSYGRGLRRRLGLSWPPRLWCSVSQRPPRKLFTLLLGSITSPLVLAARGRRAASISNTSGAITGALRNGTRNVASHLPRKKKNDMSRIQGWFDGGSEVAGVPLVSLLSVIESSGGQGRA